MILEREDEGRLASEAMARVAAGGSAAVLIEGPAGAGKTTVLRLFADTAAAAGVRTLSAQASQLESGEAWAGVRRVFGRTLREAGAEGVDRLLAGAAANARPALRMEPATGEVIDPFTCIHGLYWLTASLAEGGPLAILIDDVQWLDEPSARWLANMISRSEDLSVALAISRRIGDPVAAPAPVTEIELLGELARVRPRALSVQACSRLVGARLDPGGDDVGRACHRATGGNPLFVTELCRALAEEDPPPASEMIEAFGVEAVARSVRQRLGRLPPQCVALAEALAVLGDQVETADAAALADLGTAAAAEAAHALAGANLIEAGGSLRFRHPILQSSLYESLDPGERSLRHRRAAAALHDRGGSADRIASHLLRVDPRADDWVVERLGEAARAASQQGAGEVAAAYLRRALQEPPTDAKRPLVRFMHALAAIGTGTPEAVADLTSAVRELPAADRPRAALDASKALGLMTAHEAALEVCALGIAGDEVPAAIRSRITDEMVVHMLPVDRTRWPEVDPLQTYRDAPDPPDAGAAALRQVSRALTSIREGVPLGLDELQAALPELAGEFPTLAFVGGGFALIWTDHLAAGLDLADSALAHSRATGSPTGAAQWSTARASALLRLGRTREAVAEALASVEFNADQAPSTLAWPMVPLIDSLLLLGDVAGAREAAGRLRVRPAGYLSVAMYTEALGRLALAEGDAGEAERLLAEAGMRLTSMEYAGPSLSSWRSWLAIVRARAGRRDEGAELAREEIELATRAGSARCLGLALLAAALCAEPGGQREPLERAVAALHDSPARAELALAQIELGSELRVRGDDRGAREVLAAAMATAQAGGAAALEERARAAAVAAGARPRRRALSGAEALTPAELRVAVLVADGLSNRDAAEALFLSEKTVEGHLRGIFRKLGIRSRTGIAPKLGRSGSAEHRPDIST